MSPIDWICGMGEECERYAYPKRLNDVGFCEDFFDQKSDQISIFWETINKNLTRVT